MAWVIEFDEDAERNLGKLDRQMGIRVIRFLSERVAERNDPRGLGMALKGSAGDPESVTIASSATSNMLHGGCGF